MFNPKEIQKLRRQMKSLGIDKAALEKAAESLMNVPELRKVFENKPFQKGFEGRVDVLYDEVQKMFDDDDDHKETPDGCEKEHGSG